MKPALVSLIALAAGCHDDDWLHYHWDDRRVLCSQTLDDLSSDYDANLVEQSFDYAANNDAVALFHAHTPGKTITRDAIEYTFQQAQAHGLEFVGYDELFEGQPARPAVAFAFDDHHIDDWWEIRDLFQAYDARVTFFISRFDTFTDEGKAKLAALAADGHQIEAHTMHHASARTYGNEHGADAYVADEVRPSMDLLRDAGYATTAFAYPFGSADESTWDRILALDGMNRVRVGPKDCPY
jgi:hypothetical protein